MRSELESIWNAIDEHSLPNEFDELFDSAWDEDQKVFNLQETFLIDYKDRAPRKFSSEFGASIIRLALAFYNTFGGIIVFGVDDKSKSLSLKDVDLDIESFNSAFSECSGVPIECLFKRYLCNGDVKKPVSVLLIPKRRNTPPARLQKKLQRYRLGALWIRDRHQVIEATSDDVSTIYSCRDELPSSRNSQPTLPIQQSLPPSPATIRSFVGRQDLMHDLWDWFVFGRDRQPRQYLFGPGGSGKSTLAWEFASQISKHGYKINLPNGGIVDYVIYLSAKTVELDTFSGAQQKFAHRVFTSNASQIEQILINSGFEEASELSDLSLDELFDRISNLFDSFNGLIVIDDIDAISLAGEDTGEESLFASLMQAKKHVRVLYTLRNVPQHALKSSTKVPGLSDDGSEFSDFVTICCEQFKTLIPDSALMPVIAEETQRLPLLIEALIGMRRLSASYDEAIETFRGKGGDEARRYLYQREYDRLDKSGRSREVLAALANIDGPMSFTGLADVLQLRPEKVKDSFNECAGIFLQQVTDKSGQTLHQLASPALPFIKTASRKLVNAELIARKTDFKKDTSSQLKPDEQAMLIKLDRLIRIENFDEITSIANSWDRQSTIWAVPRIVAIVGQAYSNSGGEYHERARECFKQAFAAEQPDIFAMRAWYRMELFAGNGLEEAKRICNRVAQGKYTMRDKSEFWAKLGECYYWEAEALLSVSLEKSQPLLVRSVDSYFQSLWIGRNEGNWNRETLRWLEKPLPLLARIAGPEGLLEFAIILQKRNHDIEREGAKSLMRILRNSIYNSPKSSYSRFGGKLRAAAASLDNFVGHSQKFPNMSEMRDAFNETAKALF